MSLSQLTTADLESEMAQLAERHNITPAENRRLEQLLAEHTRRRSARVARIEAIRNTPGLEQHAGYDDFSFVPGRSDRDVFSSEARGRNEAADLALRAVDVVERSTEREVRPEVRSFVHHHPDFAEQVRATSDPKYMSAFAKLILAGDHGRAFYSMDDQERAAVQRVRSIEARTVQLTPDTSGGVAVPVALDSQILITNTGTIGRVRDLATIVTGISDVYRGINSAGVDAAWYAESAEVSDGSPTLASNDITAHKAAAFIPFSIEIESDWQGMIEQMRRLLADAKDRLENEAFINGDGSGKPYGILNRLDAEATVEVLVDSSGAISAADIMDVFAAVPARYRANASWLMSLDVLNSVRALGDDKLGNFTADLTAGYGWQLLGRPVYENSSMPDFTTGTTAGNYMIVGDVSQYRIFDRLGSMRVELVNHLFHASNNRPSGERGVYAWWRTGADLASGAASTEPGMRVLINKTS